MMNNHVATEERQEETVGMKSDFEKEVRLQHVLQLLEEKQLPDSWNGMSEKNREQYVRVLMERFLFNIERVTLVAEEIENIVRHSVTVVE